MRTFSLAIALASVFVAAPVLADEGAAPPMRPRLACRSDLDTLCPGLRPGPARRACLRDHRDALSASCRDALEAAAARRAARAAKP